LPFEFGDRVVWGLAMGTDEFSGWVGEFAEGVAVGLGVGGDGEVCDRWDGSHKDG
jgi:hypothetical protein